MTRGRQRSVWGFGLLAYLAGLFFFMLMPIMDPFIRAVVLLACASSSGAAVKDDLVVMGVIVAELVIWGGVVMASMAAGMRAYGPLVPSLSVTGASSRCAVRYTPG